MIVDIDLPGYVLIPIWNIFFGLTRPSQQAPSFSEFQADGPAPKL